jgi:hypothetical protein
MFRTFAQALLIATVGIASNCPAFAQLANNPARATQPANGAARPSRHTYRVPRDRVAQMVREVPGCQIVMLGTVSCAGPVTGNYGQVEIDSNGNAFVNGRPPAPPSYPIPSTPPPAGVLPARQAEADQLWNRASGLLDRKNARNAMPLLYQGALMGDRRAEATLGIRYQDGDGVKADDHAAAYWFGLAAAQGHRASQYALAGMYQEGEGGLPKDPHKATELLIKSANQGFDQAQYALGFQYEVGDDVPRNRQKAIELFRASGDGIWIANVLAGPKTPARFANFVAFGNYLASLRNAEFAAAWARAQASLPRGGGGGNIMAIMKAGQYRGAGGSNTGQTLGGYTATHN